VNVIKNVILSLFLSGCGFYPAQYEYIDPEIKPYVDLYKQNKLRYLNTDQIRKLYIGFGSIDDGFEAECETKTIINGITNKVVAQYRSIYVSRDRWLYLNDTNRQLLIYHELGHCDLGFEHTSGYTIMNPDAILDIVFNTDPDYYLDLFFNKGI
jgi:hypothetical protein